MSEENKKHDIDEDLIRRLAELLDENDLTELEYGSADWHVRVAKGAKAVAAVAAPSSSSNASPAAEPSGTTAPANHPGLVVSPMVGVVYLAEKPESPPLIKAGDTVEKGQTLVLIEAMKVFNPIQAPKAGTVTQIFATNEAPVEFGEPLLIIE